MSRSGSRLLAQLCFVVQILLPTESFAERSSKDLWENLGWSLHGYGLALPVVMDRRESNLNPSNILAIPNWIAEPAIGIDLEVIGIESRFRLTNLTDDKNGYSFEFSVQELSRAFGLGDRWEIIIGKRMLFWDVGLSFTPLGFFQTDVDRRDLMDRQARGEGLPLVAISFFGDGFDLTAVYSYDFEHDEDGMNRGLRQWAVHASTFIGPLALGAVVQQPSDSKPGVGGSLSLALGEFTEIHASFFSRKGTRRPILRDVLNGTQEFYYTDPYTSERKWENKWRSRWVLGVQWTPRDWPGILLEWQHDERGLSTSEWNHWRSLVEYHLHGSEWGVPIEAVNGNLAFDARTLLPSGTRRDYLFARVSKVLENTELSISSVLDVVGPSAVLSASVLWLPSERWEIEAVVSRTVGGAGTEFDYVPVRTSGSLLIKVYF